MTRDADLIRYYSARAAEYEALYARSERQRDLATLRGLITDLTTGERVLELGCGTGYWTRVMAKSATEIHAVDASAESIEVARNTGAPSDGVTFEVADFEDLGMHRDAYSTMVAGFLWSHIPLQEIGGFLARLADRLGSGTRAVFFDNRYVDGSSSPISHRDRYGNCYQERTLTSGERFTIIKNFPTRADLLDAAGQVGSDAAVEELQFFWLLRFRFGSEETSREQCGSRRCT